jgi:hypothetical protein
MNKDHAWNNGLTKAMVSERISALAKDPEAIELFQGAMEVMASDFKILGPYSLLYHIRLLCAMGTFYNLKDLP